MKSFKFKIHPFIYFSPFVFPLYLVRFQLFNIPFTVLELYLYLLFALWIIDFLLGKKIHWNTKIKQYTFTVGLLFLGSTLGAVFAPDMMTLPSGEAFNAQTTAWGIWKGWVVSPMLYFWVLLQYMQTAEQVEKLMKSFVYSGTLLVLLSYAFGLWADGFTYDARLRGPFESANYLSLYLGPAFLLATYFLFNRKKCSRNHFFLSVGAWAILAYGLFFTQSYGAFLAVFTAFGLYVLVLLLKKPHWRQKLMTGFLGVLVGFFALLASQWNTPKFQQMVDFSGRSSSSVRIEIYRISLHMIAQQPFLGLGPGLFQAHYQINAPEVLGEAPLEWNMPHPHNIFLAFWLNAGFLGILALILLIILVHKRFTYPLVALWGIFIHGLVDTPFWKNDLAVIFWLLVAGVILLQELEKKEKNSVSANHNTHVNGDGSFRGRVKEHFKMT